MEKERGRWKGGEGKEGGGNERKQKEKKSDEMQRLLASLHGRLWELISGVQSAEKTPTYNLTPTLTFMLGLL